MSSDNQPEKKSSGRSAETGRGTALITGASEGIGHELSKIFAREGYDLVVVARNEKKLREISDDLSKSCGVSVKVIPKDLSKRNSPDEIYNELKSAGIKINVLVNNAGYNVSGAFSEADFAEIEDMLQVLVWTPTKLTNLFLKDFIRQNNCRILNVGSIVAFAPSPFSAVYSGSKAYLLMFTKAIAAEIAGSGVTISILCPGSTRTQFASRARMEDTRIVNFSSMSAEKVAGIGYEGLMKDRVFIVPGLINKLMVLAATHAPWKLISEFARYLAT